jgi:DNA-binding response OmpR family regulator
MARVLLIDDDAQLVDVLTLALTDAGHEVHAAKDGVDGLAAIERVSPAVAILDVNMPRLDGFAVIRKLRADGSTLPVLMLTSRDDDIDEALGLELGADDYVGKPFSTRVLLARVTALVRRDEARAPGASSADALAPIVHGKLTLDLARMEARWAGAAFVVTVTELKLLEALATRPGLVLSRARLLELARGDDSVVADRLIDTYVRRLRRKIEALDASFDRIETVVGAGYRWRA